ncbi:MAG: L-lactate dehydrogenase [Alphaproteobacteria bacterium]|nr:L-lactate dehydrogenase [Alphaproteobacteria bacterium]MBQ8678036.1 L-lactate dehydrogenase [Alphaproteobacteria bacterium]
MKVGIIGAGNVGSATAFGLIMQGIARKVILIDTNEKRADAEASDIAHATPFSFAGKIKAGTYADLNGAKIVIITAGANQKQGEPRTALLERNVKIFESIIPQVAKYAPDCIMLIAANPVDIMTSVALKLSGFPPERVFGSGTVLDSARFRTLLGYFLNVSPKSVHANVLGEHGDSEVLIWSSAVAGSLKVEHLAEQNGKLLTPEIKKDIDSKVRNAAYRIIEGKGATNYGVAGALGRICQAIASNEHAILNVSAFHETFADSHNICLSHPCIIGKRGIIGKLSPYFNEEEQKALKLSAEKIENFTQQAFQYISAK